MAPILRMANKPYGVSFCCCCLVTMVCQTLQLHGLQHARLPCPSPSPRVCPSSCPLNWWCHQNVSSSVTLFSFCLQPFPASGSFPMSQMFASGSQNIGASALASVFPMSIYSWFPFKICWFDLRVVQGTLALNAVMLRGSVKRLQSHVCAQIPRLTPSSNNSHINSQHILNPYYSPAYARHLASISPFYSHTIHVVGDP